MDLQRVHFESVIEIIRQLNTLYYNFLMTMLQLRDLTIKIGWSMK